MPRASDALICVTKNLQMLIFKDLKMSLNFIYSWRYIDTLLKGIKKNSGSQYCFIQINHLTL